MQPSTANARLIEFRLPVVNCPDRVELATGYCAHRLGFPYTSEPFNTYHHQTNDGQSRDSIPSYPNTISNVTPTAHDNMQGLIIVDDLMKAYEISPISFTGNSNIAFNNRENVFKLTKILMSDDFVKLFNVSIRARSIDKYKLAMLKDILALIDIDGSGNKPRYNMQYHRELMVDAYSATRQRLGAGKVNDLTIIDVNDFKEAIPLSFSENNTNHFIQKTMVKGGIELLITILHYFYGTVYTRTR